jgi:hypothetical protein
MRPANTFYLTLAGLPLAIALKWPFHPETAGSDSHVLHGDVKLMDGSGLHAAVSVHVSAVMRELLPGLDPEHAEDTIINALRKEADRKQLEFLKTSKLQPVPLSSRFLDFKTKKLLFQRATDADINQFLMRKVYWAGHKLAGKGASPQTGETGGRVWIADPMDAQYLGTTLEHLRDSASGLEKEGLIRLDGVHAVAADKLIAMGDVLETQTKVAFEELQRKHAFERG